MATTCSQWSPASCFSPQQRASSVSTHRWSIESPERGVAVALPSSKSPQGHPLDEVDMVNQENLHAWMEARGSPARHRTGCAAATALQAVEFPLQRCSPMKVAPVMTYNTITQDLLTRGRHVQHAQDGCNANVTKSSCNAVESRCRLGACNPGASAGAHVAGSSPQTGHRGNTGSEADGSGAVDRVHDELATLSALSAGSMAGRPFLPMPPRELDEEYGCSDV